MNLPIKTMACLIAATVMAGCTAGVDMSTISKAGAQPVLRHDTIQALVSNGQVTVAGTQDGAVLTSADGAAWTRLPLAASASIIDLAVCPDGSFVGLDFNHRVWAAARDARNWTAHAVAIPHTPLAITCSPDGAWWVVGTNATLATSKDVGATWTVTDLATDAQLTAIQFVDAEHGLALGEFGMRVATSDGGRSWSKQLPIPHDFYPYSMLFLDRQQGWVSGLSGQILHTSDGGANWEAQDNPTGQVLYRLFLVNGRLFGAGAAGTIVSLHDGQWRPVPQPGLPPAFLSAATGVGQQEVLVVGGPAGLLARLGTVGVPANSATER